MWYFYLCTCILIQALTGGYAATVPEALHYIGVGYNLVRGNPDGEFWTRGGDDPGFLATRKILTLSSGDVPSELVYEHHDSCRPAHKFDMFTGPASYQRTLLEHIRTSGTSNENLTAAAFVLSNGFKAIDQQTRRDFYVFQDDTNFCEFGSARYQLNQAQTKHFGVTDEFAADVCKLPLAYQDNEDAYQKFVDAWGTHATTEVEIGSKTIKRYMAPIRDFVSFAMENSSRDVSVGGSYLNHASSIVVDMNSYRYRKAFRTVFGNLQDTLSLGSQGIPEPIGMHMKTVSEFVDQSFWQNLADYTSRGVCPHGVEQALGIWKGNLEMALAQYPGRVGARAPIDGPAAIPVVWPKGTYSLAKPKTGCPKGDFTWFEGWRFQDTESQTGDNAWSDPINLDSVFNKGDVLNRFCTKGEKNPTDFDLQWPKGDYCMFKYGDCPAGFAEGYVKWDDEDDMNRNDWQGVLPDGVYDEDTLQRYCCRSDALATEEIILPTDKPFYLFQYKSDTCQKVHGMTVTEEWLRLDDEDFSSPSKSEIGQVHPNMEFWNQVNGPSGTEIYYCYYVPN